MTIPQPVLDDESSHALDRLLLVIEELVEGSGGRWTFDADVGGEVAAKGEGVVLLDERGLVRAIVTEDRAAAHDAAVTHALEAVLVAYDAVVVSELRSRHARARAERAEETASRDHLTGLINRRAWEEATGREDARCHRSGTRVAVTVIDLDEMKEINDTQGHLAGDLLLRRAANVLTNTCRSSDVVARIGGDEFAVLAVDLDEDPQPIERRISDALLAAGINASVGTAVQAPGERLRDVFHRADLTMYATKRGV